MTFKIRPDDLSHPATRQLVSSHVDEMRAGSEPEAVHAYDLERLRDPAVTLWSAWHGERVAGVGGLAHLDDERGELKSFRTHVDFLGRGVGRRILRHAIGEARIRGYRTLWLETGTAASFDAARHLYASEGFEPCGAFGDYAEHPESAFMTMRL
ncbi:GNAT family N-acetyltransferase [Microbacterium karelineae]|uniref:GNAT family N-acetyltransferase n=1 Tax=Microbacterium karelineae TaxID=2654283 RepID=UPI0012EAE710|nr:GNAT family N-acetyltransferase [Microbacterium karelineae]